MLTDSVDRRSWVCRRLKLLKPRAKVDGRWSIANPEAGHARLSGTNKRRKIKYLVPQTFAIGIRAEIEITKVS